MKNNNYLNLAYLNLITYVTPQKIIDYIKNENLKVIIGNPTII